MREGAPLVRSTRAVGAVLLVTAGCFSPAAVDAAAIPLPPSPTATTIPLPPSPTATVIPVPPDPPLPAEAEPGTWSSAGLPPGPDGRMYAQTAGATELGLFVLFGGITEHGMDNDTYWFDVADPGAGWHTLPPGGPEPAPRASAATAWDPVAHRMLLFGGVGKVGVLQSGLLFGLEFLNDVWALQFDPTGASPPRWEQLSAGSENPLQGPTRRAASAAVYDPVGRRLIVHGGNDTVRGYLGVVGELGEAFLGTKTVRQGLDEVWAYDLAGGGGWTKLAGGIPGDEPTLFGHQAAYDPLGRRLVVTGGITGNDLSTGDLRYSDRTWSFDLAARTWSEWSTTGESPAMAFAVSGYSPERRAILVARGGTHYLSEVDRQPVYALTFGDGAQGGWTALPSAGTPHPDIIGARGATVGETLLMLGGNHQWSSNEGFDNDARLSAFDASTTTWTTLVPDRVTMSPTAEGTAAYDSSRRHLLIVGGRGRPGAVWELDLAAGTWRRVAAPGPSPEGAKHLPSAYDSARDRLLVLSGHRVHALELGEQPRWSIVPALGDAPALSRAQAVYDPVRDRLLLFGGQFAEPQYASYFGSWQQPDPNDEVFALHLSGAPAWRELPLPGPPAELVASGSAYDPLRDRVLLFGGRGVSSGGLRNDVLELSLAAGGGWRTLAATGTRPSARDDAVTAFDAANDRLLVYGGDLADAGTYALGFAGGGAAWSKLATAGDPAPRDSAMGVYDAAGSRLVVFGGYAAGENTDLAGTREAYALSLGGTAPEPPSGTPEPYVPPEPGPVAGGDWSALGPFGANTIGLALSPAFAEDRTIYAGTVNERKTDDQASGLFVSRDAGATWQPGAGDIQGAAVLRIAPSPANPDVVYAATRGAVTGTPVYVSRDRGASWTAAGDGLPSGAYFALAAHPGNPGTAWAGGDGGGMFRTLDGGASWESLGFEDEWVYGLTAVPLASGVRLLAGARNPSSAVHGAGRVYLSDDLGESWSVVHHDPEYVNYGFAYDPSDPRRVLLTAGRGIWRSEDGGLTWSHLADRAIQAAWLAFDPASGGQVVWGAGVQFAVNFSGFAGGQVSPAQTPGLFRSTDGGESWDMISSAPEEDFGGVVVSPDGDLVVATSLATGPYVGSGGGVEPSASGFSQSVTGSIAVDAADPDHLVAAAHYDGAYVSDDGGESWSALPVGGNDVLWEVAGSPVEPGRFLGGNYSRAYKSEDGGRTWSALDVQPGSYFRQGGAFAFHPTDASTWHVATADGRVATTHDNGDSFTYSSLSDTVLMCPIPIAISRPNPNTLLVGDTCGRGVFRSADGGATWSPSGAGMGDGNVTALAFHPTDPDLAWAGTLHRGVYRSTDGGRTWEAARVGLGYRYVRSIAVNADGRVFAAVWTGGVYESDDGGVTWTMASDGLTSRDPLNVLADEHGRVLAATNGGGAFRFVPAT